MLTHHTIDKLQTLGLGAMATKLRLPKLLGRVCPAPSQRQEIRIQPGRRSHGDLRGLSRLSDESKVRFPELNPRAFLDFASGLHYGRPHQAR